MSTRPPGGLSIALATASDPRDPSAFSGWPASLLRALTESSGRAIGLDGRLPARLELAATLAGVAPSIRPRDLRDLRGAVRGRMPAAGFFGRPVVLARSASLRMQLRRARPVDGCMVLGSEFLLPAALPTVTYQDSTLIQARRSYPWPHLQGMSDRQFGLYAERQRAVYRAVTACCCSSQWAADSVVADYGIPREKVHVVGIGRNNDVAAPSGRDWGTPRFLFVGFDWVRKNGPMTVEAFSEVRRSYPEAELHLVGGHPPVDAPGVVGHGLLRLGDPGDADRLAGLFRRATCFVMVSLHEPSATVYAEAAAAGIASIGTTEGGSATIIGPGGMLVDPRDPRALAGAMTRLADPDVARRLGALATVHAQELTWAKVTQRLIRAMGIPGVDAGLLAAYL